MLDFCDSFWMKDWISRFSASVMEEIWDWSSAPEVLLSSDMIGVFKRDLQGDGDQLEL